MKKKNGISKIKLFIILLDIVVIIGMIIFIKINKHNDIDTDNDNETINYTKFNYKVFEYNIPSVIETAAVDDYNFSLKTDKWYAVVEILVDEDNGLVNYIDKVLSIGGYNIDDVLDKEINGLSFKILDINSNDRKQVYCLYKTQYRYVYEISLYNVDNTYDDSGLETISSIIANSVYNADLEGEFVYHKPDYSSYVNND